MTLTPARTEELDVKFGRCTTSTTYRGGAPVVVIHYAVRAEALSELLAAADENARLRVRVEKLEFMLRLNYRQHATYCSTPEGCSCGADEVNTGILAALVSPAPPNAQHFRCPADEATRLRALLAEARKHVQTSGNDASGWWHSPDARKLADRIDAALAAPEPRDPA